MQRDGGHSGHTASRKPHVSPNNCKKLEFVGRHTCRYSRRHTGAIRGRNTQPHTTRHMSKITIRHSCNILFIYVLSETLPDIEADITHEHIC